MYAIVPVEEEDCCPMAELRRKTGGEEANRRTWVAPNTSHPYAYVPDTRVCHLH